MVKKKKPKRSLFDKAINVLCYVLLTYFVIAQFSHLYRTISPIGKTPNLFERHYVVTGTFPFISSYFLMKPKGYNTKYSYPIVVELHGISKRAYATEALSSDKFRQQYPFFVMIPIAPKRAFWATPQDKNYQMKRNIPYADHLPFVISGLNKIKAQYQIDPKRTIIAGHSMGGSGVIAAMQKHPTTFSAGIASAGAWPPNEIGEIKSPLFIYHGEQDKQIPVQNALSLKAAAQKQKKPIWVQTLARRGHHIGEIVYKNNGTWDAVLGM